MKFLTSESISCKSCGKILKQPVVLPCGHSICKRHEIEENQNRKIECIKCNKSFDIPVDGFAPNCDLDSLLEQEIEDFKLGDEYKSELSKCVQFEELLEQLKRIKNDPEMKIHTVMSDLRSKVDVRREELKQEIDKEALKMIEKINEFEIECKSSIKSSCDLDQKLESWTNDLTACKQSLNSLKKEINNWKSVLDKSTSAIKNIQTEYLNLNDGIFLNRLNELKCSQLSISTNFQTIRMEVNELSKYKDIKEQKLLINNVRAVGINWQLEVYINRDEDKKPLPNSIKFKLTADLSARTENYKCDYDLIFVDQLGMGKSNVKNLSYEKMKDRDRDYGLNFSHLIKLKDLMENYNLYNIEKDSCIVQAVIKRIEFF